MIEIDQLSQKGLIGACFLQYASIRVDNRGSTAAPIADSIYTDKIVLIE